MKDKQGLKVIIEIEVEIFWETEIAYQLTFPDGMTDLDSVICSGHVLKESRFSPDKIQIAF